MRKLKEINLNDESIFQSKDENNDSEKADIIIDDAYAKRAVVDSNLDADVKIYILEKILNKQKNPEIPNVYIDRSYIPVTNDPDKTITIDTEHNRVISSPNTIPISPYITYYGQNCINPVKNDLAVDSTNI